MEQLMSMFRYSLDIYLENTLIHYLLIAGALIIIYTIAYRLLTWLILLKAYTLTTYLFTTLFSTLFIAYLQYFSQFNINKATYVVLFKILSLMGGFLVLKKLIIGFILYLRKKTYTHQV